MCQREGCPKVARPSSRLCAAHGGGKRCDTDGCSRLAQGSTSYCVTHGGGCRCAYQGCTRGSRGMSGLCRKHTTMSKLAKETSKERMRIAGRDHRDQRWESYRGMPFSFGAGMHQSAGSAGMHQRSEGPDINDSHTVTQVGHGAHEVSFALPDNPLLLLPVRNQSGNRAQQTAMLALPVPLSQEALNDLGSFQGASQSNALGTAGLCTYAPAYSCGADMHGANVPGGGYPLLPSCTELFYKAPLPLFSAQSSTAAPVTAPPSHYSLTPSPSSRTPMAELDLQLDLRPSYMPDLRHTPPLCGHR